MDHKGHQCPLIDNVLGYKTNITLICLCMPGNTERGMEMERVLVNHRTPDSKSSRFEPSRCLNELMEGGVTIEVRSLL